jgi:hypothetical protein
MTLKYLLDTNVLSDHGSYWDLNAQQEYNRV